MSFKLQVPFMLTKSNYLSGLECAKLLWITKKLENESGMRAEIKVDELKEAIDKKLDNSLFNNHYHEGLKRKVIVEIPEGDANETNSESVQKVDNKRRNKVPDKPLEKQK